MSMDITNNYGGAANVYVTSQQKIELSMQKKTDEAKEPPGVKGTAANKNSNNNYLNKLQKQIPDMKLKAGEGFSKPEGTITHCITINPKLLEKMQNDPEIARKYTQRLEDIQRASNYVMNYYKAKGDVVYYNDQWYIDENGNHSHFAQTIIKDRLNERLRKETEENAKKHIEKMRENTRKKMEELAGQLEEKAKEETAKDKAQKLLSEKLDKAENGVIFLNDEDTKVIIEAAKEYGLDKPNAKEQSTVGGRIDLHRLSES